MVAPPPFLFVVVWLWVFVTVVSADEDASSCQETNPLALYHWLGYYGSYLVESLEGWVWIRSSDSSDSSSSSSRFHGWHLNSLFVAEATMFNMTMIVLILFFWIMNRQIHLRPTKGSTIRHKKSSRRRRRRRNRKKKQAAALLRDDPHGYDDDDDDDDEDDDRSTTSSQSSTSTASSDDPHKKKLSTAPTSTSSIASISSTEDSASTTTTATTTTPTTMTPTPNQLPRPAKYLRRKSETMKALVTSPTEEEDDDDDDDDDHNPLNAKEPNEYDEDDFQTTDDEELPTDDEYHTTTTQSTTNTNNKNKRMNLLNVLKKIKVFSYLNENAQTICLEYMEYIDIPNKHQYVFKKNQYDGSLYAVVHGTVQCLFHDYQLPMEQHDDNSESDNSDNTDDTANNNMLTFTSGPGDIVTPLLALIHGLVQDQKKQKEHSNNTTSLLSFTNTISLRSLSTNTRLIRIPPECFSKILHHYPFEVHRIIHTVVCRIQRVSIQILVKTLGLSTELYNNHNATTTNNANQNHYYTPTLLSLEQNQHKPTIIESLKTIQKIIRNNSTNINNWDPAIRESIQKEAIQVLLYRLGLITTTTTTTKQDETTTINIDDDDDDDDDDTTRKKKNAMVDLLTEHSSIVPLKHGELLTQTGFHDNSVYLLIDGNLELGFSYNKNKSYDENFKTTTTNNTYTAFQHKKKDILYPGAIVNTLSVFSGEVSFFTTRGCRGTGTRSKDNTQQQQQPSSSSASTTTSTTSLLLKIPDHIFNDILQQYPKAMMKCLENFLGLISPLVHLLSWNTDWMQVNAAELIAKQGTKCDSMYLVLNGRLRSHYNRSNNKNNNNNNNNNNNPNNHQAGYASSNHHSNTSHPHYYYGTTTTTNNGAFGRNGKHLNDKEEYGRGICVGNIEGLTGNPWPCDVYAIRNSEVFKVPMKTLLTIIGIYPKAGLYFAKSIASRVLLQTNPQPPLPQRTTPKRDTPTTTKDATTTKSTAKTTSPSTTSIMPSYGLPLATIAVVPFTYSDIDKITDFCLTLQSTLSEIAPARLITKKFVRKSLGDEKLYRSTPGSRHSSSSSSSRRSSRYRNTSKNSSGRSSNPSRRNTNNNAMHDLKLTRLLGDIEENHRLVVYQADIKYTWWTRLCIQQADLILLVVDSNTAPIDDDDDDANKKNHKNKPKKSNPNHNSSSSSSSNFTTKKRIEQCLAWAYDSMNVRIEMVVVSSNTSEQQQQPQGGVKGVAESLKQKLVPNTTTPLSSKDRPLATVIEENEENEEEDNDHYYGNYDNEINVSDQLNNWFEKRKWIAGQHIVREPLKRHQLDFKRLCRRVTGKSVGLVLGGGGARGLAHLGVIRALHEAGITVDMVGGTSQGAFIGALYAKTPDNYEELIDASKKMAVKMASTKELLLDLTLPMTSVFSGRRFNYTIRKLLKKLRIQDLVLKFFCMSTDLQKREQVVHTKGLLWKYVRASMSLCGYLPPVAENGSLLVDGGYTNVVPADVMRYHMGARTVIAVDVSGECHREYFDYGTHLSGWWILFNSLNPFARTVQVPSMGDLSDSLRWVSSDQHRKNIIQATDLHLVPPVSGYGTLDYGYFDELVEIGYDYAKPIIDEWVKRNPHLVSSDR